MFQTTISPRFYETDALGHVNNTAVPGWFETAREAIFRLFCPDLDIKTLPLILARIEVDFIAQIHYGSQVSITTGIEKIGNSSFTVCHEAFQNGIQVARGRAVQVYFNPETQRSGPIPAAYREQLALHLTMRPEET